MAARTYTAKTRQNPWVHEACQVTPSMPSLPAAMLCSAVRIGEPAAAFCVCCLKGSILTTISFRQRGLYASWPAVSGDRAAPALC